MNDSYQLSKSRIVCAANRIVYRDSAGQIQRVVVPSARHHDRVMNTLIALLVKSDLNHKGDELISNEQGFMDQHCRFYTREEAWVIAQENNQIRNTETWNACRNPDGTLEHRLFSENLY